MKWYPLTELYTKNAYWCVLLTVKIQRTLFKVIWFLSVKNKTVLGDFCYYKSTAISND